MTYRQLKKLLELMPKSFLDCEVKAQKPGCNEFYTPTLIKYETKIYPVNGQRFDRFKTRPIIEVEGSGK